MKKSDTFISIDRVTSRKIVPSWGSHLTKSIEEIPSFRSSQSWHTALLTAITVLSHPSKRHLKIRRVVIYLEEK